MATCACRGLDPMCLCRSTRRRRAASTTIATPYVSIAQLNELTLITRGHGPMCPCDPCRTLRAA